jgi:hypothetical protein
MFTVRKAGSSPTRPADTRLDSMPAEQRELLRRLLSRQRSEPGTGRGRCGGS